MPLSKSGERFSSLDQAARVSMVTWYPELIGYSSLQHRRKLCLTVVYHHSTHSRDFHYSMYGSIPNFYLVQTVSFSPWHFEALADSCFVVCAGNEVFMAGLGGYTAL